LKRPLSITLVAALFLMTGTIALAYHAAEIKPSDPFRPDVILILFVRLLAVIGGFFLLRGCNWARWLLVIWLAYHVVLSAFHSASEAIIHAILLAVIAFFLFRRRATEFFRTKRIA
jgi:hypothetical protein